MFEGTPLYTKCLKHCDDPLEKCLNHFGMNINEDHIISEVNSLLESTPLMNIDKWKVKMEPVLPESILIPSVQKPPKLELKPRPELLKHVFLGSSETLPIILSYELNNNALWISSKKFNQTTLSIMKKQ